MSTTTKERQDPEIGCVQWHSSEDDGGPDVGIMLRLTEDDYLWAGEITRRNWEESPEEVRELGGDMGWWLILYENDKEPKVIGRVEQYAAGDALDVIAAAIRAERR